MNDLVDEWIKLKRAAERAQERLAEVEAQLMPTMAVGDVLKGRTGDVRKRDRGVLIPALLEARLSARRWQMITVRTPSAPLYRAEIKRGRMSEEDITESSKRSKPWLEMI